MSLIRDIDCLILHIWCQSFINSH